MIPCWTLWERSVPGWRTALDLHSPVSSTAMAEGNALRLWGHRSSATSQGETRPMTNAIGSPGVHPLPLRLFSYSPHRPKEQNSPRSFESVLKCCSLQTTVNIRNMSMCHILSIYLSDSCKEWDKNTSWTIFCRELLWWLDQPRPSKTLIPQCAIRLWNFCSGR